MPVSQILDTAIEINGRLIPAFSWDCTAGTYGQLGRANINTTATTLRNAGINILSLTSGNKIPVTIYLNGVTVFGGYLFIDSGAFEANEIQLTARDFAATLFDTTRSIADITNNNLNQTVSQLVTRVAALGGFAGSTLVVDVAKADDVTVGTIMSQNAIMATQPTKLWTLLVYLARMSKCTVHTTPQGVLRFEQIKQSPNIHNYSWLPVPLDPGSQGPPPPPPALTCGYFHQIGRNKNFAVVYSSYHAQTVAMTTSTVVVAGEEIQIPNLKTIPRGTYTAAGANQVRSLLSARGLGIPIFTFSKPGLTPDQVRAQAEGIAFDISTKLLSITITVPGNLNVNVRDQLFLSEGEDNLLLGFSGWPLFITGVGHKFAIPQGAGIGRAGFLTTIQALTLPPSAADAEAVAALFEGQ